jgi:hypothetical protein
MFRARLLLGSRRTGRAQPGGDRRRGCGRNLDPMRVQVHGNDSIRAGGPRWRRRKLGGDRERGSSFLSPFACLRYGINGS